jgi:hypothetical protein
MQDFELKILAFQVLGPLATVMAFAPVVLYLVARWRAHREPIPDPQLGLKFALYYFATMGLQLALAGITLLAYTMLRPGDGDPKGEMYRMALGFILPAGLVLGAHIALLVRTNDRQHPGVRRLFVGFNLLITGIVGFTALVAGAQALFAKGSTGGMGHLAGAAILIYCATWGVLAWQLDFLTAGRNRFDAGEPPSNIVPPGSTPDLPPGGSGLPSLGGGAYPPLGQ